MGYRLREGVLFCRVEGRVIMLDIRANRYFAHGDSAEKAFLGLFDPDGTADRDEIAIAHLIDRDVLERHPDSSDRYSGPERLQTAPDWLLPGERPVSIWLVARVILSLCRASMDARLKSLASIKRSLARRRSTVIGDPSRRDYESYEAIAAAFERTEFLFSPADRCLPRSLAFVAVCNKVGLAPRLIFGVKTNPFVAHCWVQTDERILYDHSPEANLFTPILAL